MEDRTTIQVDRFTHDVLKRTAQTRRWKLNALMRFLAEMFASSLDGITDEDIPIEQLKEFYERWELAIHPYGVQYYE